VSERALAKNEALFREVNERIHEISDAHDVGSGELVGFLCECSRLNCGGTVELSLVEYEAARANPRVFIVSPGHEQEGIERVVERLDRYLLVEKVGDAGEVARETVG
jgi:hypothetical protein